MQVLLAHGHSIEFTSRHKRRLVLFKLNTRCNLQCSYCWYSINPQLHVEAQDEMSLETVKELVERISLQAGDVVYLSGGEPVLRNDIVEICRCISSTGATVYMTTNGTLLDRLLAVSPWIDGYVVSLDSVESEYHDIHRGQHQRTAKNIEALVEQAPVCVSVVLSQQNIEQLSSLADFCVNLKVNSLFCQLLWYPAGHPERQNRCLGKDHVLKFNKVMNELRQRKSALCIPVEPYLQLLESEVANDGSKGQVYDCFAQGSYIAINPYGTTNCCTPHALLEEVGSQNPSGNVLGTAGNTRVCQYFSEECSCLMGHFFSDLFDDKGN